MSKEAVAVSSPGKVLFTGGFLVLDRKHTGLVFGLDARIHVRVQPLQQWGDHTLNEANGDRYVLVESPQFHDARWLYRIGPFSEHGSKVAAVLQITDIAECTKSKNKFVEVTLTYVLTYLRHVSKDMSSNCKITILADDSYYSQSESSQDERNDGFRAFGVSLSQAHKTGLGSSAALVTSLTAALLTFHTHQSPDKLRQSVVHNLAQAAHCAAQGKVGSGFDVAAAVYGSCLYKRFSPSVLESIGDADSDGFGERLHQCVEDLSLEHKWDVEISSQAVRIPKQLLLMMCDVDCGSETPGMVRKVLQWRKEKPTEAELLWSAIQRGSDELCVELLRLSTSPTSDYSELADILQTIRSLVREESQKSEVPIEPEVISQLLDDCTAVPGVIGGVAPGAGGYDAVALLLRNDSVVVAALKDRLANWSAKEKGTGVTIGKVKLLDVKQANEGIRLEDPKRYASWV